MENTNFTKGDLLTDEVNVDLYVLRPTVIERVCCHVYNANVVTEDNRDRG